MEEVEGRRAHPRHPLTGHSVWKGWSTGLGYASSMSADLDATLLSVWEQSLIDKKKTVEVGGEAYAVRQTAKSKLKPVDFRFEDREWRG